MNSNLSIFQLLKNPGGKYTRSDKDGSYDYKGDRGIKLGLNVYCSNKPVDTIIPPESKAKKAAITSSDLESNIADPTSIAQMNLLCKLIGKTSKPSSDRTDFKLDLFNNDEEEL